MTKVSLEKVETLAQWIAGLGDTDIPDEVVCHAALIVADTVGCMIGSQDQRHVRSYVKALHVTAGGGQATVIGTDWRPDVASAAAANCFAADALEFSDSLLSHPALTAVPVALALGEWLAATGLEVLRAVVVGYEAGVRFGRALVGPTASGEILPSQWAWQGFIAAAAAASLLQLPPERIVDAFGHVSATTPVPVDMYRNGFPLSWGKTSYAEQTRAGLVAALLAQVGFAGSPGLIVGHYGYARSGGYRGLDSDELTAELGQRWLTLENQFKRYPACRMTHAAYEASLSARNRLGGMPPEQIASIEVSTVAEVADWLVDADPAAVVDATFSIPYIVAVGLLGIDSQNWYHRSTFTHPTVRAMALKVSCTSEAKAGGGFPYPAHVRLIRHDGISIEGHCRAPRGLTDNAELQAKFVAQTEQMLGRDGAEDAWQTLMDLPDADGLHQALTALRVRSGI